MSLTTSYLEIYKKLTFNELHTECQLNASSTLLYTIRSSLERFSREDRKDIVSRLTEGNAPLFEACKKGNVEIVKYLIDQCDADVEQRGVYEFPDDKSTHFVTPLWCASVAGKLSVVRCLVERGANINSVSDTGSTPVRIACYMNHYEIVLYLVENNADILKPNFTGGTCLINSTQSVSLCDFLIQHGADVNAQDIHGQTALHYAIQENNFETTKFLLDSGADPFIKNRSGDDALQTACLKNTTNVFDYLCQKYAYTRERIAEAHELIGSSTFFVEHLNLEKCLYHWGRGLDVRYNENPDNPLPKNCVKKKAPYGYVKEFTTFVELKNLAMDLDAMRIQSLLVCERILGPLHRDMIFRLISRGVAYADSGQYQCCINLFQYVVELRIQKDGLLHNETSLVAQALAKLFLQFHHYSSAGQLDEQIKFDDMLTSIRLLVSHFEESKGLLLIKPVFKQQQDNFDEILKVLTHLIYVLYVIPKTTEQVIGMKQLLSDILRLQPQTCSGNTLLHLVVSRSNVLKQYKGTQAAIFPNPGVVELLLQCGAEVEIANSNLSTPLHIAALKSNFNSEIIQMLLNYGAHIDRRNCKGHRPHVMLQRIPECTVDVNNLQYTSLKCFAARKLVDEQISYSGQVPVDLEDFIKIH